MMEFYGKDKKIALESGVIHYATKRLISSVWTATFAVVGEGKAYLITYDRENPVGYEKEKELLRCAIGEDDSREVLSIKVMLMKNPWDVEREDYFEVVNPRHVFSYDGPKESEVQKIPDLKWLLVKTLGKKFGLSESKFMNSEEKNKNIKMKHVKLFESWLNEADNEKPRSITIELTDEFRERMREMKNSEGNTGFVSVGTKKELSNDGNRYDLVKVGTIPYDIKRDLQFDFWASYRPEADEIYVNQSNSTAKDLENSMLKDDSIPSTAGIVSKLEPGYYCKFENGFKVGEVDHRGYFKIVAVRQ